MVKNCIHRCASKSRRNKRGAENCGTCGAVNIGNNKWLCYNHAQYEAILPNNTIFVNKLKNNVEQTRDFNSIFFHKTMLRIIKDAERKIQVPLTSDMNKARVDPSKPFVMYLNIPCPTNIKEIRGMYPARWPMKLILTNVYERKRHEYEPNANDNSNRNIWVDIFSSQYAPSELRWMQYVIFYNFFAKLKGYRVFNCTEGHRMGDKRIIARFATCSLAVFGNFFKFDDLHNMLMAKHVAKKLKREENNVNARYRVLPSDDGESFFSLAYYYQPKMFDYLFKSVPHRIHTRLIRSKMRQFDVSGQASSSLLAQYFRRVMNFTKKTRNEFMIFTYDDLVSIQKRSIQDTSPLQLTNSHNINTISPNDHAEMINIENEVIQYLDASRRNENDNVQEIRLFVASLFSTRARLIPGEQSVGELGENIEDFLNNTYAAYRRNVDVRMIENTFQNPRLYRYHQIINVPSPTFWNIENINSICFDMDTTEEPSVILPPENDNNTDERDERDDIILLEDLDTGESELIQDNDDDDDQNQDPVGEEIRAIINDPNFQAMLEEYNNDMGYGRGGGSRVITTSEGILTRLSKHCAKINKKNY